MSRCVEFPCPGCAVVLPIAGELTSDGTTYPIFQCDHCTVSDPLFGDIALTFALDENGAPFDPASDHVLFDPKLN